MSPLCVLLLGMVTFCSAMDLDPLWEEFKSVHQKTYVSTMEEKWRRSHWEKNVADIQKHNLEYDLGQHTYTMGINQYSDWSPKEYEMFLNELPPEEPVVNDTVNSDMYIDTSSLPRTVDWRRKGYVTPVKNQGACGSCWAFSVVGSLEGQHFRKTGKLVSLSEQNLVDCNKRNNGCNGGRKSRAFTYVEKNGGLDTEASYPYTAKEGKCRYDRAHSGATCSGYKWTRPRGSESALQRDLATIGPIAVSIDSSSRAFRHYSRGVLVDSKCSSTRTNHAVLAVGYGTENGQDYWLVKNSWGTRWGESGYIKMARNHGNMCAIALWPAYPLM